MHLSLLGLLLAPLFPTAQAADSPRLLVLDPTGADFEPSRALERRVVARVGRSDLERLDLELLPGLDLYQAGRREPDRALGPADQRAVVPDEAIDAVLSAAAELEATAPEDLDAEAWLLAGHHLREKARQIWFVDRPELRAARFAAHVQIGRAASLSEHMAPPLFEQVGDTAVNYHWYLAGAMAWVEPDLIDTIDDPTLQESVLYFKDLLDRGDIALTAVSFDLGGAFDPVAFATEAEVTVDGLPTVITDPEGRLLVPPGPVDLALQRGDGHGWSDTVNLLPHLDRVYHVQQTAQRNTRDAATALVDQGEVCEPELDDAFARDLAIYAALHPDSEIWLATPKAADLWRWDRESLSLTRHGCED